jgi:ribosomal protein S18 acetylase RimI-like enzyme
MMATEEGFTPLLLAAHAKAVESEKLSFEKQKIGLSLLGAEKVNLQVRSTNVKVISFYRGLGCEVEDRINLGKRLAK